MSGWLGGLLAGWIAGWVEEICTGISSPISRPLSRRAAVIQCRYRADTAGPSHMLCARCAHAVLRALHVSRVVFVRLVSLESLQDLWRAVSLNRLCAYVTRERGKRRWGANGDEESVRAGE